MKGRAEGALLMAGFPDARRVSALIY